MPARTLQLIDLLAAQGDERLQLIDARLLRLQLRADVVFGHLHALLLESGCAWPATRRAPWTA